MEKFYSTKSRRIWRNSVNRLVSSFREGLEKLRPVFDKAGIHWKDGEQSENFEGMAESFFDWIVRNNLDNHIQDKYHKPSNIAKYNFYYKDYSKIGFIEVKIGTDDPIGKLVLLSFGTKIDPFDTIICNKINAEGGVLARDIKQNFKGCRFTYQHRKMGGELEEYEEVSYEMDE